MSSVTATIRKINDEVGQLFFERDGLMECIWLGILSGEHVFVIGEPGTGKTELAHEILERIVGDTLWTGPNGEAGTMFWRQQFLKATPLEKLAGAIDVPALRERGEYHHKINGFLPTARFALADELGKASPIAQDPLLSMTAGAPGKRYFDNNAVTMTVPLLTMVATSNEELTEEEQAAIWDRMTLRDQVFAIRDPKLRLKLVELASFTPSSRTTIEFPDLYEAIFDEVPTVTMPTDVAQALANDIPQELGKKGLRPSDRRIRKAGTIMRANAYMNGRSQCEMDDLAVLRFMLWDTTEQRTDIERTVLKTSNPVLEEALQIGQAVEKMAAEMAAVDPGMAKNEALKLHVEVSAKLKASKTKIAELVQDSLAHNRSTTKLREIEARVDQVRSEARAALDL